MNHAARIGFGTAVTLIVLPLATWLGFDRTAPSPEEQADAVAQACERTAAPSPLASPATQDSAPTAEAAPAISDEATPQVMNLGRLLTPAASYVLLPLSEPLDAGVQDLFVRVGPFKRADGRTLPKVHLTPSAVVAEAGRRTLVEVSLCVDPVVDGVEAHAGAYTGSVIIDDPRVTGGAVTFTVQMKSRQSWLVGFTAYLAMIVGFVGAVGTIAALGDLRTAFSSEQLPRRIVALGAAAVAVFGVVMAQYIRDPSWQGGLELHLTFFVTAVTAAFAAASAAGSIDISKASKA